MPIVRIVSLGEVIQQNQQKALMAFAQLINPGTPMECVPTLMAILQSHEALEDLNELKLGKVSEDEFIQSMIDQIKQATDKKISPDEFRKAWNAMNPKFSEFYPRLSEVLKENKLAHDMIFVSHTNPIDMKYLEDELRENKVNYTLDENDQLASIDDVHLYTTYVKKMPKAELIVWVIEGLRKSTYAFFTQEQPVDIKYVRGIEGSKDRFFHPLDQQCFNEVKEAKIPTLLWDWKNGQIFKQAIHAENSYELKASTL